MTNDPFFELMVENSKSMTDEQFHIVNIQATALSIQFKGVEATYFDLSKSIIQAIREIQKLRKELEDSKEKSFSI